jgi:hypothetical protein
MARLTEQELAEIIHREVEKYEGTSPHARIFVILDDRRHSYTVTGIENDPGEDHSWIVIQARVVDDFVIIDEDNVWDKKLWKALVAAGVPREQIVLAYQDEKAPQANEP